MSATARELTPDELGRVRRTALNVCLWWTALLGVVWAVFVLPLGAQASAGFVAIWLAVMAAAYPVIMNVAGRHLLDHDA